MHGFGYQPAILVIPLARYYPLEVWQILFHRTFGVTYMDLAIAMSSKNLLAHYNPLNWYGKSLFAGPCEVLKIDLAIKN